jgi:hypothetical protein
MVLTSLCLFLSLSPCSNGANCVDCPVGTAAASTNPGKGCTTCSGAIGGTTDSDSTLAYNSGSRYYQFLTAQTKCLLCDVGNYPNVAVTSSTSGGYVIGATTCDPCDAVSGQRAGRRMRQGHETGGRSAVRWVVVGTDVSSWLGC